MFCNNFKKIIIINNYINKLICSFTSTTITSMSEFKSSIISMDTISNIQIAKVEKGNIVGDTFNASELWKNDPILIYVVRRPG